MHRIKPKGKAATMTRILNAQYRHPGEPDLSPYERWMVKSNVDTGVKASVGE